MLLLLLFHARSELQKLFLVIPIWEYAMFPPPPPPLFFLSYKCKTRFAKNARDLCSLSTQQ